MIGRLAGKVIEVGSDTLLVDVHGVGYEVHCPAGVLAAATVGDGQVTLAIETVVREDLIRLYGFSKGAERDWFRLLQSVQGVGAKVALAILSILDPDDLSGAVAAQDHATFARAQGVGPKLAKRIVTELKDKAPAGAFIPTGTATARGRGAPATPVGDAVSALVNLGYGEADARRAVDAAASADEAAGVETLIREALKRLL